MRAGKSQGTLNWQTNEAYLLTSRKPKSFENIESRILNTQFIEVPQSPKKTK
jgi:hypothetical protein